MSDALTLWCFLEGDIRPFRVKISGQEVIDELTTAIHTLCADVLSGISARRLTLYKPKGMIALKPSKSLSERIPQDDQLFDLLEPVDTVSECYPTLESNVLHVLVRCPKLNEGRNQFLSVNNNKRQRLDTGNEVQMTCDEYARLGWEEEESTSTWALAYNYWRRKDYVEDVCKQTILTTPFEGSYSFPRETKGRILVLEQYRELFNRAIAIKGHRRNGGILLTGQPGVGKTTWLYFMFICLVTKGEPVAFYKRGTTRLFYQGHVYKTQVEREFPRGQEPWCLIDCDHRNNIPPEYIIDSQSVVYPVQASSPNPTRYKSWIKERSAEILGMQLWSEGDILKGFRLQEEYTKTLHALQARLNGSTDEVGVSDGIDHIWKFVKENPGDKDADSILDKFILHLIQRFGKVPRTVYGYVQSNRNDFEGEIDRQIKTMRQEELKVAIMALISNRDLKAVNEFSHKILAIIPKRMSPNSKTSGDYFVPTFLSDEIAMKMKERFGVLNHESALELFNQFRSVPESASFAGWIFESIAHRALESADVSKFRGDLIPMVETHEACFSTSTAQAPDITFTVRSRKREMLKIEENFLGCIDDLEAMYFVPVAVNNPLFDSFIFELNESADMVTPIVWIFQMTIGKLHKGSEKGYHHIRLVRKRAEKYGHACAQKMQKKVGKAELKYVLVIPSTHDNASWSMPAGWRGAVKGKVFCQKIDTSMLGVIV